VAADCATLWVKPTQFDQTRLRPEERTSRSYAARVEAGDRDAGIDLAELLAAFSLATDLGLGQPTPSN